MNRWQELPEEFHRATGGTVGYTIDIRDRELRAKLIMEEAVETVAALGFAAHGGFSEPYEPDDYQPDEIFKTFKQFAKPNLVEFIDGMCDLIYVVTGSAVAAGVDLDPHFEEVHRANMTKLAGPKREDGKQLKPEGWEPPDHDTLLVKANQENERWQRYLHGEDLWKANVTNWTSREAERRHERLTNGEPVT